MLLRLTIVGVFVLRIFEGYTQNTLNSEVFVGTMEIRLENPIPDNTRFRVIILVVKSDTSVLTFQDYRVCDNGSLQKVFVQSMKSPNIDKHHLVFEPINDNFRLIIKRKKYKSILKIEKINARWIRQKQIYLSKI